MNNLIVLPTEFFPEAWTIFNQIVPTKSCTDHVYYLPLFERGSRSQQVKQDIKLDWARSGQILEYLRLINMYRISAGRPGVLWKWFTKYPVRYKSGDKVTVWVESTDESRWQVFLTHNYLARDVTLKVYKT